MYIYLLYSHSIRYSCYMNTLNKKIIKYIFINSQQHRKENHKNQKKQKTT